ncbi:TetR/AcrR family transcriptional regulator [Amycolatopsis sp. PS_44_ISF1]|uniref:TetR/AcrR family transcriptional regulator n=1 Tax=Amycolatopsis sp. PS_44_ISF1 TaxID=2974917 RepID=UPI0028DFA896|nr:TetR/AcrR family transcriptional regulator [Amycolatopsis sp. PS_44_ISF1]MDT8913336.1 TetR/AcrR family transcriptional regulator [Amycolatopsis sp. PS_44_ISF1]
MTRGEERADAILDATLRLLARGGYRALTLDAVAAEAHASKATIYRRWPGKPALVKSALDAHDVAFTTAVADTGSLRGDLLSVVDGLRRKTLVFPITLYAEFVQLMEEDSELADALRRHLDDDELSPFREPLARAVARGEARGDVDHRLVHDVAEAMVVHRLQLGHRLDEAFATRLVDQVLLVLVDPVKTQRAHPAGP